jgi:hypothetical protein
MLEVLSLEELTNEQIQKARNHLEIFTQKSPVDDLYWLILPFDMLSKDQLELSKDMCFKIAIEITSNKIRIEMLVRTDALDNTGGGSLTKEQYQFMMFFYCRLCSILN